MRRNNVLFCLLVFVVLLAVLPAASAESPLLKWMRTMKAIGAVWRDVYHPGSVDASEFSPESAPKPVPVSDLSKRWKRYEPPSSDFLHDENEADEMFEPSSRKRVCVLTKASCIVLTAPRSNPALSHAAPATQRTRLNKWCVRLLP
jgi:hypothetical protein